MSLLSFQNDRAGGGGGLQP